MTIVHELALECPEKAFDTDIVPTVAGAAHPGGDAVVGSEHLLGRRGGILADPIRVVPQPGLRGAMLEGHRQRLLHEGLSDAEVAVGLTRLPVEHPNGREQSAVAHRTVAFGPVYPGVIASGRDKTLRARERGGCGREWLDIPSGFLLEAHRQPYLQFLVYRCCVSADMATSDFTMLSLIEVSVIGGGSDMLLVYVGVVVDELSIESPPEHYVSLLMQCQSEFPAFSVKAFITVRGLPGADSHGASHCSCC